MPIYAYRCSACGHAKDVLQKLSEPALEACPACGADAFRKQITAAGFQLKGSGWYATDFKGGAGGGTRTDGDVNTDGGAKTDGDAKPSGDKPAGAPSAAPAAAGGCGASCACH